MKKDIAIFVNSFIRDDMMYRCTKNCMDMIPNGRIYLTDNGRMTQKKEKYYSELRSRGHVVDVKKEFNYWWRRAFNEKLDMLQGEKYVLKIDDDFFFAPDNNLNVLVKYLERDKKLGMIGGEVWHDRHNHPSFYVYDIVDKIGENYKLEYSDQKNAKNGYIYCDMIPDFWLAKIEIFKDIKMENDYQPAQGGHEVFFRKIYERRMSGRINWRVGYTNDCQVVHEKSSNSEEYTEHRYGGFKSEEYYANIKVIKPKGNPPNMHDKRK